MNSDRQNQDLKKLIDRMCDDPGCFGPVRNFGPMRNEEARGANDAHVINSPRRAACAHWCSGRRQNPLRINERR